MTAIIVGHSHTVALGVRQNADSTATAQLVSEGPIRLLGLRFNNPSPDALTPVIEVIARADQIVLMWLGNIHNSLYLLSPRQRFDFVLSSEPDLPVDHDATLVPEALVEAGLRHEITAVQTVASMLIDRFPGKKLILISPPPPKSDNEFIRGHLSREFSHVLNSLGITAENVGITSAFVRLKTWKLFSLMHKQMAESLGASFLPPPKEALDEQGFLLRENWLDDVTHANAEYGKKVLSQIFSKLLEG